MERREFCRAALATAVTSALDESAWSRNPHGAAPGSQVPGYDGVISVSGSGFVNATGAPVQLRGTNLQSTEAAFWANYSTTLGSTGVTDVTYGTNITDQTTQVTGSGAATSIVVGTSGAKGSNLTPWKFNCVRIGLNDRALDDAGYTGYVGYNLNSATSYNQNNYGSFPLLDYLHQIAAYIASMNSIGCYVVLTMHYGAGGLLVAAGQDADANQEHTIRAWTNVANAFGYPNGTFLKRNGGIVDDRSVIFETYNEPTYASGKGTTSATESIANWQQLMNGGWRSNNGRTFNSYGNGRFDNSGAHITEIPVKSPTGGSGSGIYFTPGESWTATDGSAGKTVGYWVNTTTGYDSSGTTWLTIYNATGSHFSGGVPTTAVPIPAGTVITGSSSGAQVTVQTSAYTGQSSAGENGWYNAGGAQLLAAIRATGAWNPVLLPGTGYTQDLSLWSAYAPTDSGAPAGYSGPTWVPQIGAAWHPYPYCGTIACVTTPITIGNGGSGYVAPITLSGVSITGTSGQFSCNSATMRVGQILTVSGSLNGTGSIQNYTNPTDYVITAQAGTTFTAKLNNSALVTSIGTVGSATFTVSDGVLLLMDQTAGQCLYQTQFKVTGVSGGAITSVGLTSGYLGGIPGVNTTGQNQISPQITKPIVGGEWYQWSTAWSTLNPPANPIAQDPGTQPGTSGTGATFNVSWTYVPNNFNQAYGSPYNWPDPQNWPWVVSSILQGRGCPLFIGETGGHYAAGQSAVEPYIQMLTAWCDSNNVSITIEGYATSNGWSSEAYGGDQNLVYNGTTPLKLPGVGTAYFNWSSNHAP